MSEKLIVHKFEDGAYFKSLNITIGNNLSETTFGEWIKGKPEQKKKKLESSRLIVKLVSGNDSKYIDFDSCFKEITNSNLCLNYSQNSISYKKNNQLSCNEINLADKSEIIYDFDYYNKYRSTKNQEESQYNISEEYEMKHTSEAVSVLSPLECSLEKVKENNAKIMENIQILNRTLNYTKKKEIFNLVWPCSKTMKTYPCKICGKCFVYITGLKRHYAIRHIMPESHQRWQTVWTCPECFQVWPRQDLASNHSNQCGKGDSPDSVHEIKTSLLLQCEFCEKVFTSIPRLLRHTKIHSIESNYECNACNKSFLSYKSAEQHWLFCPWLHTCYKFLLPKLLLCNACDRKFRNYEQLYNHRYKVGHFITKVKIECNTKSSYLVYQCEICGEWFHSIPPLQAHRSHFHPHCDSGLMSKCNP